jgi:hypothetical protein
MRCGADIAISGFAVVSVLDTLSIPPQIGFMLTVLVLGSRASLWLDQASPGSNKGLLGAGAF